MKTEEFEWPDSGMMVLVVAFFIIMFIVVLLVSGKQDETRQLRDVRASVVAINGEAAGLTGDKFPHPQMYTVVLCKLESTNHRGKYFEVNSRDGFLEKGWVYNHKVNDTITFKVISIYSLFDIKGQ